MENVVPFKIQILSILGSLAFLFIIGRMIVKGKLREEYALVWLGCTVFLIVFAFWRNGLEIIAAALGVFYAPALIFLVLIFAIIIFLVHLSVVNSRQQKQIKDLTHEIAFLKNRLGGK
jgi:hypothetical protein